MRINTFILYRLLLFLVIVIPEIMLGQVENYPRQTGIGIKAGASYSNLVVSFPIQQMNNTYLPTYGLIFTYIDAKYVGVQFEINYVTKSWEEKTIDNFLYNATLDYLEIPMFTTFHFGNRLKFIINFGPYLSILLNQEGSSETIQDSEFYPYYENRIPKKIDFGLNGGIGLRFNTGLGLIQMEVRYIHSFQDLYDPKLSTLDYSTMQTLGLYLSYQISFSHGR